MSSVSKLEKEKAKLIQEKCQLVLGQMLRDEDNKFCVDCDAKGPRWASWNLGIFLCIRCAGIHRNLGVHISRVKSVNLDSWTPEQVVTLQQMGNSRARAVYEANLPDNFRRPQTDSTLESFIRAKYEHKKYIAREWVPPAPVKVSWDVEIEFELKQKKEAKRKATNSPSGTSVSLPGPVATKPSTASIKTDSIAASTTPKETPAPIVTAAAPAVTTPSQDLLGLDIAGSSSSASDDIFGALLSGPTASQSLNNASSGSAAPTGAGSLSGFDARNTDEENFFNQKTPSANEKKTLDKNSILALYNQGSSNPATAAPVYGQVGFFSNHQAPFNQTMAAPTGVLANQILQVQGNFFQNQSFSNGAYGIPSTTPMTQLPHQLAGLSLGPAPAFVQPMGTLVAPNMVSGIPFNKPSPGVATIPSGQMNPAINGQSLPPNFWQ